MDNALANLELSSAVEVATLMDKQEEGGNNPCYAEFSKPDSGLLSNLPTPRSDLFFSGSALNTPRLMPDAPLFCSPSPYGPLEDTPKPRSGTSADLEHTPIFPLPSLHVEAQTSATFVPTPPAFVILPDLVQTPQEPVHAPDAVAQIPIALTQTPCAFPSNLIPFHQTGDVIQTPYGDFQNNPFNPDDLFAETPRVELQVNPITSDNEPPEVRRRLFEDEDSSDSDSTSPIKEKKDTPQSASPVPSRSGNPMQGLKARLAPPPPITIPGPPNTTPGGIYEIAATPKPEDLTTVKTPKPPRVILPALYTSNAEPNDEVPKESHQGKRTAIAVQRKKNSGGQSEEEKRPVMSERASQVLAEMRRQMSQARSDPSGSRVKDGADTTNYLPYSSSIQAPLGFRKAEGERTVCNCKASQCIKRYCPCFATSNFCGKGCGCRNCENTTEYSSVVGRARRVLLERDPNAFVPRIRNTQRSSGRGRATNKGCNCRKGCEKNYCICRENGLVCGMRCTCCGPQGCRNNDETKLDKVPQVLENAEPLVPDLMPRTLDFGMAQDIQPLVTLDQSAMTSALGNNEIHPQNIQPLVTLDQGAVTPTVGINEFHRKHPAQHRNTTGDYDTRKPGPFEVLPTPTTPSLPNHPIFDVVADHKKRTITFGEPTEAFKKIRVGDYGGKVLKEMRQSSTRYTAHHYKTPPPKKFHPASSFMGTPLTERLLAGDTPPSTRPTLNGQGNANAFNEVDQIGEVSSGAVHFDEKRLPHIPRIFRYKFGSGNSVNSFTFKS